MKGRWSGERWDEGHGWGSEAREGEYVCVFGGMGGRVSAEGAVMRIAIAGNALQSSGEGLIHDLG